MDILNRFSSDHMSTVSQKQSPKILFYKTLPSVKSHKIKKKKKTLAMETVL